MFHLLQRLWSILWLAFALVVIVCAVGLGALRLLLPLAPQLRTQLQDWAAETVHRPVQIDALRASWQGLGPAIELEGVELLDREGQRVLMELTRVQIGIDLVRSLRHWEFRPSHVQVVGTELVVERREDGSVGLRGLNPGRHQRLPRQAIMGWLLSQRQLTLEDSVIEWRDARRARAVRVTDVDLSLRNAGLRHQVSGTGRLPEALGGALSVEADFAGSPQSPRQWRGRAYVAASKLVLPAWSSWWEGPLTLAGGQAADVEVWGTWQRGSLQRLTAIGRGGGVILRQGQGRELAFDQLAGRVQWAQQAGGWRLTADELHVTRKGKAWPTARLDLRVGASKAGPRVALDASFVDLADAAAMMSVMPKPLARALQPAVKALAPRGRLQALRLRYEPASSLWAGLELSARVTDLGLDPWQGWPGLAGVDAAIRIEGEAGFATLHTREAAMRFPGLFRQSLTVRRAQGRVHWQRIDEGWRVWADEVAADNRHIRGEVAFDLMLPEGSGMPRLTLQGRYRDGVASQASRYLPAGIIPEPAMEWLDQAFVDGRVTEGTVVFDGPIQRFPFDAGQGRFEVAFHVEEGVISYRPQWPVVRGVSADVRFTGRGLAVTDAHGRILDVPVHGRVTIADLAHPEVLFQGGGNGPAADMLEFLRVTGQMDQRPWLQRVSVQGPADLALELRVDVGEETTYRGNLGMNGVSMAIQDGPAQLNDLRGHVRFRPGVFVGEQLQGRIMGRPLSLGIETQGEGPERTHVIAAHGELVPERWPGPLGEYVSGTAQGAVRIEVPGDWRGQRPLRLSLESSLEGTEIALPQPLRKRAGDEHALTLVAEVDGDWRITGRFDYADFVRSRFQAVWEDRGLVVRQAGVGVATGTVPEPAAGTLRLEGRIPRLPLAEWLTLFRQPGAATVVWPQRLEAQVNLARADIGGRTYHNLTVDAQRDREGWRADIQGQELGGQLRWSARPRGRPVQIDLRYLNVVPGRGDVTMPAADAIPPLWLRCRRFSYDGVPLGTLAVDTRPAGPDQGLILEAVRLDGELLSAQLTGEWIQGSDGHRTRVEGRLETDAIGRLLARWGYAGGVEAERTTARFALEWSGTPLGWALGRVNGRVDLSMDTGRLSGVEPGAGRIFGLLSLQALPRRLTLDFRDFFRKGLSFDTVAGRFRLVEGDAYTSDLTLRGPTADIEVEGRVGLVDEDFDQRIAVTPRLSSSLPLAGALAGGPGVGAALFLTEKLFKEQIDEVARYHYRVTGGWDDPRVVRLSADDDG